MSGPARSGRLVVACWLGLLVGARALSASPGETQRLVLDNGLVLLFRPNPAALTVAVCCFVKVSALVENKDTAGLRNLTQQTLLDSKDQGGRSLNERLAELGMQGSVQLSSDYVETTFLGTADQLSEAFSFTREVLKPGDLERRVVALRRTQVLEELSGRAEVPLLHATDMATGHLYQDTPCAWPAVGTVAVAGLTLEQIAALRRMRYVPNNAVVAVSGNVTWEGCQAEGRRALGDLLPRQMAPEPSLSVQLPARRAYLYSPWAGDSAAVMMVAPCPPPSAESFPGVAVLNVVLGCGEGSRLFRALRRERSLAYTVSADLVPSHLCGILAISAICEPSRAAEVFHVMQDELAALRTRPASEAEVQRAQAYLTGSFVLGHQRNSEAAHYLGLYEVLFPGRVAGDLAGLFSAATPGQVERAVGWLWAHAFWVQVGGTRPE